MKKLAVMILCVGSTLGWWAAPSATALPQFQKQFLAKYVAGNKNSEFVKAAKAAKCNICHVGIKKTNRNPYGQALSKLLDKKQDRNNVKKIIESLEKVAGLKSKPDDPKSFTFGELIKRGKLPGETN